MNRNDGTRKKETKRMITLAASLVVMSGAGCSMQLGIAPGAVAGWRLHEDAAGIAVQVPEKWTVARDGDGAIGFTGPDGIKAKAQIFSSVRPLTVAGALDLMGRLAGEAAPGFTPARTGRR